MTRFEQEINGLLGEFWKKEAENELQKRKDEIANNEVIFENGIARWTSNNRVVPDDIAIQFSMVTDLIDVEKCKSGRDCDNADFFKSFKGSKITDEEKIELDANFEPNTKIVNLMTGEVYFTK